MDQEALRRLIRGKLQNGRLPHEGVQRIWSSPSDGETCDACDTVLAKDQVLLEGSHWTLAGAISCSCT